MVIMMCGRFYIEADDFKDILSKITINYEKEIYPGTNILAIIIDNGYKAVFMHWGTTFHNKKVINARYENLSNTYFKSYKPCVVLASGYFEWNKDHEKFYISNPECKYLAAIYRNNDIVILTYEACKQLQTIHNRMPILLNKKDAITYLNTNKLAITDKTYDIQLIDQQIRLF